MNANEYTVRQWYPKARCGKDRGSARTYYCIYVGDYAVGGGETRAQAWRDAAANLPPEKTAP